MYIALKSFSGLVTMAKGEIRKLEDEHIIKDLLNAGYIKEVEQEIKKDTQNILKNEIKKDVEKIVDVVEKEVKKVTTKKTKSK